MNLLRISGEHFHFRVKDRERRLLLQILTLYPLLNPDYHRVTRSGESPKFESSQELIQSALEEQRTRNRSQIELIVRDERWLKQEDGGYRLTLSAHQIDWLLEVLNDVRVGAWVLLGKPDEFERRGFNLTPENARYFAAMELSAYFQAILLKATEGRT